MKLRKRTEQQLEAVKKALEINEDKFSEAGQNSEQGEQRQRTPKAAAMPKTKQQRRAPGAPDPIIQLLFQLGYSHIFTNEMRLALRGTSKEFKQLVDDTTPLSLTTVIAPMTVVNKFQSDHKQDCSLASLVHPRHGPSLQNVSRLTIKDKKLLPAHASALAIASIPNLKHIVVENTRDTAEVFARGSFPSLVSLALQGIGDRFAPETNFLPHVTFTQLHKLSLSFNWRKQLSYPLLEAISPLRMLRHLEIHEGVLHYPNFISPPLLPFEHLHTVILDVYDVCGMSPLINETALPALRNLSLTYGVNTDDQMMQTFFNNLFPLTGSWLKPCLQKFSLLRGNMWTRGGRYRDALSRIFHSLKSSTVLTELSAFGWDIEKEDWKHMEFPSLDRLVVGKIPGNAIPPNVFEIVSAGAAPRLARFSLLGKREPRGTKRSMPSLANIVQFTRFKTKFPLCRSLDIVYILLGPPAIRFIGDNIMPNMEEMCLALNGLENGSLHLFFPESAPTLYPHLRAFSLTGQHFYTGTTKNIVLETIACDFVPRVPNLQVLRISSRLQVNHKDDLAVLKFLHSMMAAGALLHLEEFWWKEKEKGCIMLNHPWPFMVKDGWEERREWWDSGDF